jgi:hypothetical protein
MRSASWRGGAINGAPPEGGGPVTLAAALGLSRTRAPNNGLLGVFLGDSVDGKDTPMGFDFTTGDLVTTETIYPFLQQVFYVGNGTTFEGQARVFVVPKGATRLFLASSSGGFNASGSFTANVSEISIPSTPAATNPALIGPLADLFLADQPLGTEVAGVGSGFAGALTEMSSPVKVPITLTAGETLNIRGFASIVPGGGEGLVANTGLSGLPELNGLAGVFVGDSIDPSKTPATLSPDTGLVTLAPLLQQSFYVGNGLSNTGQVRNFTVPTGATRLFLASPGGGFGGKGFSPAVVTAVSPNAPSIAAGGIVSNGGFPKGAIAAGSMVAIFGSNFGPLTGANATPLPTKLGGTQVFFNQVAAPLFFVSPGPIVAQVPFEMYAQTAALVTVVNNAGRDGSSGAVRARDFHDGHGRSGDHRLQYGQAGIKQRACFARRHIDHLGHWTRADLVRSFDGTSGSRCGVLDIAARSGGVEKHGIRGANHGAGRICRIVPRIHRAQPN